MFLEYGRAVRARAAGKNANRAMYRSYSIGAQVAEVLREAQPGLAAAGCDVRDLF
jgi:phage tail protein X